MTPIWKNTFFYFFQASNKQIQDRQVLRLNRIFVALYTFFLDKKTLKTDISPEKRLIKFQQEIISSNHQCSWDMLVLVGVVVAFASCLSLS